MMKLMWTAGLKINTVHVTDLCRAIIFLADKNEAKGQIYNVVDKGDTTQGKITEIISGIFNINHDYWGTTLSTLAKVRALDPANLSFNINRRFQVDFASLIDEANDKHMASWGELCAGEGIMNTPLDPTLTMEHLTKKNLCLDGSKLEKLGFKFEYESISENKIREVRFPRDVVSHDIDVFLQIVDDLIEMRIFPKSCVM
jgi:hypothetical protein